jgi:MFS family permease
MLNDRGTRRLMLFCISFYSGLGTMAFEMVLGRALVPYFGGTIYTWGALIAVFLVGMSVGFFAGGQLADRFPRVAAVGISLTAWRRRCFPSRFAWRCSTRSRTCATAPSSRRSRSRSCPRRSSRR